MSHNAYKDNNEVLLTRSRRKLFHPRHLRRKEDILGRELVSF